MTEPQGRQRLAAILAADAVGYSRLMAIDERATVAALDAARGVFRVQVAAHQGRVVDTAGDSVLAVFDTALGAVHAALAIQKALGAAAAGLAEERRMRFRIGVHLGDVIEKADGTVYGDGVNVAARLQALAEPGGVGVSDAVQGALRGRLAARFEDLGEQTVKNIPYPVHMYRVRAESAAPAPVLRQDIRFCRSFDGTRLAYATTGAGPVLVKAPHWLTHLEYEFESPMWGRWIEELSRAHKLLRMDERGCGLSDWELGEISFESWVRDLEAVVDAAGVERFALFGHSQGAGIAIEYAVRHPERVSKLVILGGYARGWMKRGLPPERMAELEAQLKLVAAGWGRDDASYRQMFAFAFMPGASMDQINSLSELQRLSASPENAVRIIREFYSIDVSARAPLVSCPTLLLHGRGDRRAPFEEGRKLAALIPQARLIPLETDNHILLAHEPAFGRFFEELRAFVPLGSCS